jgi:hypothetical protein
MRRTGTISESRHGHPGSPASQATAGALGLTRLGRYCLLGLAVLTFATHLWAGTEYRALPGQRVVANQLLVRFRPQTSVSAASGAMVLGAQMRKLDRLPDVYLVQLPPGTDSAFSTQLSRHPSVVYVEPNRIVRPALLPPNDQYYGSNQWRFRRRKPGRLFPASS